MVFIQGRRGMQLQEVLHMSPNGYALCSIKIQWFVTKSMDKWPVTKLLHVVQVHLNRATSPLATKAAGVHVHCLDLPWLSTRIRALLLLLLLLALLLVVLLTPTFMPSTPPLIGMFLSFHLM
jgi:hypothetical protein